MVLMSLMLILYIIIISRNDNTVSVIMGGAESGFVQSDNITFTDLNAVEEVTVEEQFDDWPDIDFDAADLVPKNLYTVVNEDNALSSAFAPEVTKIDTYQSMFDVNCVDYLNRLVIAANEAGFHVYLGSAYRSFSYQTQLFNGKASQIALGYGVTDYNDPEYQKAVEEAKLITSYPGTSEHQLGTAVDLFDKNYSRMVYENMNQEFYEWLDAHCAEYGFIKRYPTKKLLLTGWDEPWHYRFVGVEAAEFIMSHDICYEEFYAHYHPEFTY